MKLNMYLWIVGLLVGLAGCGASDGTCNPSGTWTVTQSPAAGDSCGDQAETTTEIVSVSSGTVTIVESDGTTHQGPLDGACHMGVVGAVSSAEIVGTASQDWTFTGATMHGTITANLTATADGSMCTVQETVIGVRQ